MFLAMVWCLKRRFLPFVSQVPSMSAEAYLHHPKIIQHAPAVASPQPGTAAAKAGSTYLRGKCWSIEKQLPSLWCRTIFNRWNCQHIRTDNIKLEHQGKARANLPLHKSRKVSCSCSLFHGAMSTCSWTQTQVELIKWIKVLFHLMRRNLSRCQHTQERRHNSVWPGCCGTLIGVAGSSCDYPALARWEWWLLWEKSTWEPTSECHTADQEPHGSGSVKGRKKKTLQQWLQCLIQLAL